MMEAIGMTEQRMAAVAGVVLAIVWVLRRVSPALWERVPPAWRWAVPVLTGVAASVTEAAQAGADARGVLVAVASGVLGGLGASGLHEALRASPLPYGGTS